jgi:single-stranded DNA-binding protein
MEVFHAMTGLTVAAFDDLVTDVLPAGVKAKQQRLTLPDKEAREKTQRHQVTAWGAQAEVAQQRLEKGTRVQIVGRIDQ